jgi:hypothetical protein
VLPKFSGGCCSGSPGRTGSPGTGWLAGPAGVVLGDGEAESFEFGDDRAQAVVVHWWYKPASPTGAAKTPAPEHGPIRTADHTDDRTSAAASTGAS